MFSVFCIRNNILFLYQSLFLRLAYVHVSKHLTKPIELSNDFVEDWRKIITFERM